MRYLTKSRFKLAEECPTKLYYTGKKEYADKKLADSFLAALAEGGFQVGELAKHYFPGGVNISSLNYDESVEETMSLLSQENAIIYEAAIRFEKLFIRADVLVKKGNRLFLYEVKAKSCNFDDETGFLNVKNYIVPGWKPYVNDVAFQKYVLQKAFPEYTVLSYLMLVNKNVQTSVDGLNQKFQLYKDEKGRTSVRVIGDADLSALGDKILIPVNVDNLVSRIWSGTDSPNAAGNSFEERIREYSSSYENDVLIDTDITYNCWNCEYQCSPKEEQHGYKSGFKECIQRKWHWNDTQFLVPHVMEIWDNRRKAKFLEEGKIFQYQLTKDDLSVKPDGSALSRTERQWLQVEKSVSEDINFYLDKESLRKEMQFFKYPLHFIDFETSMVAIPFNKGRSPYEQIAFQFSHHIIDEHYQVKHVGQYISIERGKFPNFDFLRALKDELEHDDGTIFRYAPHENTVLNQIYVQLNLDETLPEAEKESLQSFIRSITTSSKDAVEKWNGPRSMVDLLELVKKYFYHPEMKGSNSIKKVLPAVLQSSEYIQDKYSEPIYGKNNQIESLNFVNWSWIQKDENGKVINPYKLLPELFSGAEETENFLTDDPLLADGGAAMTAFMKMQFTSMTEDERSHLINGLLRYCELDTLAMVMIFEAWREWTR